MFNWLEAHARSTQQAADSSVSALRESGVRASSHARPSSHPPAFKLLRRGEHLPISPSLPTTGVRVRECASALRGIPEGATWEQLLAWAAQPDSERKAKAPEPTNSSTSSAVQYSPTPSLQANVPGAASVNISEGHASTRHHQRVRVHQPAAVLAC